MQDENGSKTYPTVESLATQKGFRASGFGLVSEAEARLVKVGSSTELSLHVQYAHDRGSDLLVFERLRSVEIAKEILRLFEPSALDPDDQLHSCLRRIEQGIQELLDREK